MKELIESIAKQLVNSPDQVRVEKKEDANKRELYLLYVTPKDRGKIIGRQGRTIKSIRVLIGAIAAKHGRNVNFDIYDEKKPEKKSEAG
jgi:predicted RNA-binding protein YlqC (UPF0109 family)